jgi:hypothetical protein
VHRGGDECQQHARDQRLRHRRRRVQRQDRPEAEGRGDGAGGSGSGRQPGPAGTCRHGPSRTPHQGQQQPGAADGEADRAAGSEQQHPVDGGQRAYQQQVGDDDREPAATVPIAAAAPSPRRTAPG